MSGPGSDLDFVRGDVVERNPDATDRPIVGGKVLDIDTLAWTATLDSGEVVKLNHVRRAICERCGTPGHRC